MPLHFFSDKFSLTKWTVHYCFITNRLMVFHFLENQLKSWEHQVPMQNSSDNFVFSRDTYFVYDLAFPAVGNETCTSNQILAPRKYRFGRNTRRCVVGSCRNRLGQSTLSYIHYMYQPFYLLIQNIMIGASMFLRSGTALLISLYCWHSGHLF
jgi:hypothetical protein